MITKNKKKIVVLFILVIIGWLTIFLNPKIQGMIYPGDNIKIKVKLYVNDSEVSLDKSQVLFVHNGEEKTKKISNGILKTKGKEYGEYYFNILVNDEQISNSNKELVINLKYINANRWYISNSECVINVTLDENSIAGSSKVEIKYNDDTSNVYHKDIHSEGNEINVTWGL